MRKFSLFLFILGLFLESNSVFANTKNSVFLGGQYHYNMNVLQAYEGVLNNFFDINEIKDQVKEYTGKDLDGGHSGGFYVGIETRKEGSWIAMLNTFTFGYTSGFSGKYSEDGNFYIADFQYFQMTYEIAMRAYLGIEYLFFDFGFRLGAQFNVNDGFTTNDSSFNNPLEKIPGQANILPETHFTFALGTKIPILDWLSIQAVFHTAVGVGLFNAVEMGFRFGLSFDNLW